VEQYAEPTSPRAHLAMLRKSMGIPDSAQEQPVEQEMGTGLAAVGHSPASCKLDSD